MSISRAPGARINAKLVLRRPPVDDDTPGDPYDLTEYDNYLIYAFVKGPRVIAQFSREDITGYIAADESGLDPTAGETRIVIPGNKTKDLKDQTIYIFPYIQFNDSGEFDFMGPDEGKYFELATITLSANPAPPIV